MSSPLQYSDYNNEESKTIRKNKTYKKRPTSGVLFPRPSKFKISRPQDPFA